MRSTPPTSENPKGTSLSSVSSDEADNSESSLSSSSEESSDSDDENEVVTVGGAKKPQIRGSDSNSGQDLRSRLSAFLPQLAAANRDLAENGPAHSMEEVEDGEQHIEMNLGLGVLEEKNGDESSSSGDSSEEDNGEDKIQGDRPASAGAAKDNSESKDTHVLDRLRGQKSTAQKGGIEEVG